MKKKNFYKRMIILSRNMILDHKDYGLGSREQKSVSLFKDKSQMVWMGMDKF
jgi:hypothetical protein